MSSRLTDEQLEAMFEQVPLLAGRPRQLEELSGGLTNRNVKITTPDNVYVARCVDTSRNLLGIDTNREISYTFVLGAALGEVGGVLIGLSIGKINQFIGFVVGV